MRICHGKLKKLTMLHLLMIRITLAYIGGLIISLSWNTLSGTTVTNAPLPGAFFVLKRGGQVC
jgi:hypothetical protein